MSRTRSKNHVLSLTEREKEVLTHISNGYINVEVAVILDLSPRTVEAHRARIMLKVKRHTLAGLVKLAIRMGLTNVDTIRPLGEVLA